MQRDVLSCWTVRCSANNFLYKVKSNTEELPIYTLHYANQSGELGAENVNVKLHDSSCVVCVCVCLCVF